MPRPPQRRSIMRAGRGIAKFWSGRTERITGCYSSERESIPAPRSVMAKKSKRRRVFLKEFVAPVFHGVLEHLEHRLLGTVL